MKVNAAFTKREKDKHGHYRTFHKCIQNIEVDLPWDSPNEVFRDRIKKHAPGPEWHLMGYTPSKPKPKE